MHKHTVMASQPSERTIGLSKHTLSICDERIEHMGSLTNDCFAPRVARFLNPIAKSLTEAVDPMFKPTEHSNPLFKGWNHPLNKWAEWVDQMAGKYSSLWVNSGISDSIMSSIYEVTCNHDLIPALLQFWSPKTNTFVFPWGEATVTLEDVTILGGYSVIGDSVDDVALMADSGKKVEEMNRFRSDLVMSKSKKASHSKWIQMFMSKQNGHEHEHEHIAFLSLWLSRFVFPSLDRDSIGKHVFPIAVKLSQGVKLALAPAILASIYHNLRIFKEQSLDSSNYCINLLGPFQLVQIWAYERFPIIGPKPPNELCAGEPRLARWHTLNSNVCLTLLHSHLINPENFIWRPYVVDVKNWVHPSYYHDSREIVSDFMNLDDELQSFVRFLQPCELNGLNCKANYLPHRVAMQFGFDQDIPGDLSSYNLSKFVRLFVPSRSFLGGVSLRYYDWWKNLDRKDGRNFDLDLEEGFNDVFMSLKSICNTTKRKIDFLKGPFVGESQSKKRRLASEVGSGRNEVIQID
ncbi:hypothetical protein Lser_V15G35332 [Lactuca serriola]